MTLPKLVITIALTLVLPAATSAQQASAQQASFQQLGRDVLKELIETNTTQSIGSTTTAAEKVAGRFLAAGIPVADIEIVGPAGNHKNLVVRLRGRTKAKPVLFLSHLDVVEARREDWSVDPFKLTERDGYFYGRGTLDDKGPGTTLIAALVRLKNEGFTPQRDIILALTAGEETGKDNGVQWLIANRKDLVDAEYCVNFDAGGGESRKGKRVAMDVQAAEKVYLTFSLTVRNAGGHSSLPVKDNAIYHLAAALQRLSAYDFPARMTDISRAYFRRMADVSSASLAADMRAVSGPTFDKTAAQRLSALPLYNAIIRTTCVATQLEGGHAENALPQLARAVVNCRVMPDEDTGAVRRTLIRVVADPVVTVGAVAPAVLSPPSPLMPAFVRTVEQVTHGLWGNLPVIPYMETGATDGLYLRNAGMPVYGLAGLFIDIDDIRSHGKDERIPVSSFNDGLEFAYRFIKAVGG